MREVRALINYQGTNTANRRGYFAWRDASLGYLWTADRVACGGSGGGFASKHPTSCPAPCQYRKQTPTQKRLKTESRSRWWVGPMWANRP